MRMNKPIARVLFGVVLCGIATTSRVQADAIPISQSLATPNMSAATFNSLFQPVSNAPVMSSPFTFQDAPTSGVIQSQVFQGSGAAAGYYAYAYQVDVSNVKTTVGEPVHVDGLGFQFNATPSGTTFLGGSTPAYAYVVTDGQVGGITTPAGGTAVVPASLTWNPGTTIGGIRAQFYDPASSSPSLGAGSDSATFVIIAKQPFTEQFVNIASTVPTSVPFTPVYSAQGGTISPIAAPEPASVLAWTGVVGALFVIRRVRRRTSAA